MSGSGNCRDTIDRSSPLKDRLGNFADCPPDRGQDRWRDKNNIPFFEQDIGGHLSLFNDLFEVHLENFRRSSDFFGGTDDLHALFPSRDQDDGLGQSRQSCLSAGIYLGLKNR